MSMPVDDPRRVIGAMSRGIVANMQFLRRLRSATAPSLGTASSPARRRSGYDVSHARTLARVQPMLAGEPVVWLSTVRPDGLPHLVPTWFWWDGEAMLVCSKPDAIKVRNLRANPRLMVALGRPEEDFSVGLIEAEADLQAGAFVPDAFFAKYADQLEVAGMDAKTYRATYTQVIRILPTRFLSWHGRGERHDRDAKRERPSRPSIVDAPSLAFRGTLLPAWA
jgi:PPOX class probable F420-dependent enzyme